LRETDALALSTGQHMRIAVGECIETDASKPLLRACLRVVCTYPGDVKADRNILDGCLPWKECVALKQVTGLHVQGGERLAKNIDLACGRREQPGGYIKQRGFAATRRPHDCNEFAVSDMKCCTLNGSVDSGGGQVERDNDIIERNSCTGRRISRIGCSHGGTFSQPSPPALFFWSLTISSTTAC